MSDNNNKQVTNEELARMIAKGFADTARKENTATKDDVKGVREDIAGIDNRLEKVEDRLDIVENKLDRALYHEIQRVDKLESQMKVVWDKLDLPETV
jgi:hypothetical protein